MKTSVDPDSSDDDDSGETWQTPLERDLYGNETPDMNDW
jgi:hypothetical protein